MSIIRQEKIKNIIRELAATFIEKEAGKTSFITVTDIDLQEGGKKATILITVMPREKEQAAYGFIKRNLGEMREYIAKNLKVNPIPYLDVRIDQGEKNRQKIDELLSKS